MSHFITCMVLSQQAVLIIVLYRIGIVHHFITYFDTVSNQFWLTLNGDKGVNGTGEARFLATVVILVGLSVISPVMYSTWLWSVQSVHCVPYVVGWSLQLQSPVCWCWSSSVSAMPVTVCYHLLTITHKSSNHFISARHHAIACYKLMLSPVHPLSVTRVDQSKTVEVRIMQHVTFTTE